jgi:hypothetical protein
VEYIIKYPNSHIKTLKPSKKNVKLIIDFLFLRYINKGIKRQDIELIRGKIE